MTHPCEPSIEQLKEIERDLFREESTDANMAKLKAIQCQIKRHEVVEEDKPGGGEPIDKDRN